jgi:hypothetical protein
MSSLSLVLEFLVELPLVGGWVASLPLCRSIVFSCIPVWPIQAGANTVSLFTHGVFLYGFKWTHYLHRFGEQNLWQKKRCD